MRENRGDTLCVSLIGGNDDDATLDLLTQTTGALAAIAHVRKIAELTGAARVA